MRNKPMDLHNHLFAQLERLSDEDLKGEELVEEIERSKQVSAVAKNLISNMALIVRAEEMKHERKGVNLPFLPESNQGS